MQKKVLVIGAGLAGSEAAWFLANKNISIVLCETKSIKLNPAQKITSFAELVCTNSLKSKDLNSAHGILKYEMESLGSLIISEANIHAVPAGDALAVDREKFSEAVTLKLKSHPNVSVVEREIVDPIATQKEYGCDFVICATGPLTTSSLEKWIVENISSEDFYFYDAIAPVIDADSLDYSKLYFKDRHKPYVPDEDGNVLADYLNAPLNKEEYENFINELIKAEKVPAKNFEDYKFFESCLPIDTMAERGIETARFSCMKPIGLEMQDGKRPYACVQLRRENLLGSAYNLVGFQTRLTYKEQQRVFRMIPGLENASFIHLGSVHRNSYLNARALLNNDLSSKKFSQLYFAGQISGVEGYTESASIGIYAAVQVYRKIQGLDSIEFPKETAMGALIYYIMSSPKAIPSNINFGLLPEVIMTKEERKELKLKKSDLKKVKKNMAAKKARDTFDQFMGVCLC